MTKDDAVFIQHILNAIADLESYVTTKEDLLERKIVQDAIVRKIEIIGEASKNISPSLKARHKDIPWKDIAGMRDWLVHGYFGVDLEIVWKTIQEDIPLLKQKLKGVLEELSTAEGR